MEAAGRAGPERRGARILLVDDQRVVRSVTRSFLRSAGYDVVEAGDGEEALERFTPDAVDLLITDVSMPRLGGLGLAERWWAVRPGLPVLFISGDEIPPRDPSSSPRGGFLAKPFLAEELLRAVARALEGGATDARGRC